MLWVLLVAFPVAAQLPPNFKGDFQSELRFAAGQTPVATAIGDFNGDGKPDLAVANYAANTVSILLGNGDGTFGSPTAYSAGDYPYGIAVADVNGDGHLDIVCANLNLDHLTLGGTVSVFLGNGDGTFAPAVSYVAGSNLSSVVLGDFNSDRKIDIATANVSSGNVVVLLNNGDGTFQTGVPFPAGPYPYSLGVADFNGDGNLDLAVTNSCNLGLVNFDCVSQETTVTVLLGHGNGTFGAPVSYQAGSSPFNLVVGDFNSDGKYDVAVSTGPGNPANISVLLGNGDGTFQAPASYPAASPVLATGDFNSDGVPDLIASSANGLAELLGTGTGSFDAAVKYFVSIIFSGMGNIAVGDLNRDGLPDVVVPDGNVIGIFLNAGAIGRQPTGITVASSQNPVTALSSFSVTASVTASGASPQGSITFYVDGQAVLIGGIGPPVGLLNSSNQASYLLSYYLGTVPVEAGVHSISAIYSGDTTTVGSTSNAVTQTVTAISTTTALSSTPNPSLNGQSVTLTATVSGTPFSANVPQQIGSVTFFDGASSLGTVPVSRGDFGFPFSAALSVSSLTVGTHSITAAYGNSPYFSPSVSLIVQQVVNGNLNLNVANGAQNSATIAAGNTAQYMLTIGGAGFSGPVTLSCNGAPTGATCSVTPASLTVSATNTTALNVSVGTTSRSSAFLLRHVGLSPWLWAGVLFCLVGLSFSKGKVKRFMAWALFATLVIVGCGGGSSSTNGGGSNLASGGSGNGSANPNGTPAGTYPLTVVANSGSASQSVPLTLIVQ